MASNTQKQAYSATLKVALLIVAGSFLAYSIYWAINNVIWFNTITGNLLRVLQIQNLTSLRTLQFTLLFIQEYASVISGFVLLVSGIFALYATVFFLKKDPKYLGKLRITILFTAIFSLLLIPSSIHHLVGVVVSMPATNIYVGLSYLLQALLIVPPLLVLSQKMKQPQNIALILKGATIAASLFAFALWLKYAFLWIDTLSPMNMHESNPLSTVGTVNSLFTLLIAASVITIGCLKLNKNRTVGVMLLAVGLILVGAFFIIFSLVALSVPIYASFWYLTDFWMLTLPILGGALLMNLTKTVNNTITPPQKHA